MCAIVLTVGSHARAVSMLKTLAHRGPDDQRVITFGDVSIGHASLAIVDTGTRAAIQPFVVQGERDIEDVRGSHIVAFNGEIFNYKDLSVDEDESEVQVLARLLTQGHDLTQFVNGYYAAVAYDVSRREVTLARDLFGVMPLYYTLNPVAAASEKKALDQTQKIYTVPANSVVRISLKSKRAKAKVTMNTWPFRFHTSSSSTLLDAFLLAVERVARHSDNGFSVAFSGGLDSALLIGALKALHLKPKEVITTYTQTEDTSEVDRACCLMEAIGWQDVHVLVPCVAVADLPYWIETPPNPIRDFAFNRHATVASVATTRVILCGEGADELGLGYPLHDERHTRNNLRMHLKRVSLLKSQATMTVDRVNKAGMMHSKEYRVPFLDVDFVQAALSTTDNVGKSAFRELARLLYIPESIINASKYSREEIVGRKEPHES